VETARVALAEVAEEPMSARQQLSAPVNEPEFESVVLSDLGADPVPAVVAAQNLLMRKIGLLES
jgi:hypothetical protein